jgi:hypothetical protein
MVNDTQPERSVNQNIFYVGQQLPARCDPERICAESPIYAAYTWADRHYDLLYPTQHDWSTIVHVVVTDGLLRHFFLVCPERIVPLMVGDKEGNKPCMLDFVRRQLPKDRYIEVWGDTKVAFYRIHHQATR